MRIHTFLKKLSSLYKLDFKELVDNWEKQTCSCGKPSNGIHIECETHSKKQCKILLQAGPRKHKECDMPIVNNQRCKSHQEVQMCQVSNCTSTTKHTLCIKHEKDRKNQERDKIPIPRIRKYGDYYIIVNTDILFQPSYNAIIGYKSGDEIYFKKNKSVEEACDFYHVKFIDF